MSMKRHDHFTWVLKYEGSLWYIKTKEIILAPWMPIEGMMIP